MRVLFICRSNIGLSKGGLQGQIYRTAEGLKHRGVEVLFFDAWKNQINEVDVVHCWSSDPNMAYHVYEAKKNGIPIVISPVFMRFIEPLWRVTLEYRLATMIKGVFTPQGIMYGMVRACNKIIALNEEEKNVLQRVFKLTPEKTKIVPNGIDKKFANGDPRLFKNKYGIDDFVLQVGYIEARKNALTTIKAMKDLPYKLVLVGGSEMRDEKYVKLCKKEAGGNVIFTGHIDYNDPLMASAYAAAKVFVLPSFSEVMPLVVYEAAQAGCKLVLSNTYPIARLIRSNVLFASPNSPDQFKKQISEAMSSPPDMELLKKARSMPTWQDISDTIIEVYEDLISS